MIFIKLYRKYFLNYDSKKMYIKQRNLNIIKNLIQVRYKGNYNILILRKYLLNNKEKICIFCLNKYSYNILDLSYHKPKKLINNSEKIDINLVELMCPNCHKIYDRGLHSITTEGKIIISSQLDNYSNLNRIDNNFGNLNLKNQNYINYHYKNIFVR